MTDKYRRTADAGGQYLAQRYYFGSSRTPRRSSSCWQSRRRSGRWLRRHAPTAWPSGRTERGNAISRTPCPTASTPATTTNEPVVGLREDYYAWAWGDALFVVLDPFWFTHRQARRGDNWSLHARRGAIRLARARRSKRARAKFKFVFIHHLVGGLEQGGARRRGGCAILRVGRQERRRQRRLQGAAPRLADADPRVARRERRQHRLPRPRPPLRRSRTSTASSTRKSRSPARQASTTTERRGVRLQDRHLAAASSGHLRVRWRPRTRPWTTCAHSWGRSEPGGRVLLHAPGTAEADGRRHQGALQDRAVARACSCRVRPRGRRAAGARSSSAGRRRRAWL